MKRGGISAASSRSGGMVGIVRRLRSGGRVAGRVDGAVHGARVVMKRDWRSAERRGLLRCEGVFICGMKRF